MSFPTFLVHSRRRSSSCSSVLSTSPITSNLSNSPPSIPEIPSLLVCTRCRTHLAPYPNIISKAFTGRHGRAYLCAKITNVKIGQPHERMLATGMHTVADINCQTCGSIIGWKYLAASEQAQKYKVGKYILESGRCVKLNTWEMQEMD